MFTLTIAASSRTGKSAQFDVGALAECSHSDNGFSLRVSGSFPHSVTITPPAGDRLRSVSYVVSVGLKNFHQVIVPDTGRSYPGQTQLVDFWAGNFRSRVNNVRMPLFMLTAANSHTDLAFGVIGPNVETDFIVREPAKARALTAWMKRLTLEIRRGVDDYPLPDSAASASPDGALTELLYFRQDLADSREPWIATLRDFATRLAAWAQVRPLTTRQSLLPSWCSWTDWDSNDVTDRVILDNVDQGLRLGIANYIIDDGWFGPGLDSDFSINLNIGDWREDPAKIPDLPALVRQMHSRGAAAVLWCAPHAVAPHSKAFAGARDLLIESGGGEPVMTANKFHSLCFMCPESRAMMAQLCGDQVRRYGVDGAKYDLFNCVPPDACRSKRHRHDTTSALEGLSRTLAEIAAATRAIRPDFLIELKQNYATPYLYEHGTVVRAGDTPFNPEGNYLRTAYISAYTPWALNDYQTITNYDSPHEAAVLIAKMIAAGPPTYSINLPALSDDHKRTIAFYHNWYRRRLRVFGGEGRTGLFAAGSPGECDTGWREPLDGSLGSWMVRGGELDICFVVNDRGILNLPESNRRYEIVCATCEGRLVIRRPQGTPAKAGIARFDGGVIESTVSGTCCELAVPPGAIVTLEP
jgi:hypothetical protein